MATGNLSYFEFNLCENISNHNSENLKYNLAIYLFYVFIYQNYDPTSSSLNYLDYLYLNQKIY